MAGKQPTLHAIINELVDRTNTDTQRIRVLEQREESLTSRTESIEQDVMGINGSLQELSARIDTESKARERAVSELHATIKEMIKHLKKLASTGKVNELEAMLEMYNPLKSNFMTRTEVERLISKKLSGTPKNNK